MYLSLKSDQETADIGTSKPVQLTQIIQLLMKHIVLKLPLIVALRQNPNLRNSNMSVPNTCEKTQI